MISDLERFGADVFCGSMFYGLRVVRWPRYMWEEVRRTHLRKSRCFSWVINVCVQLPTVCRRHLLTVMMWIQQNTDARELSITKTAGISRLFKKGGRAPND